jgi:hypothetical protein
MSSPGVPRLSLPQVTLCGVGSANVELTARALNISAASCGFAEAILLSDKSVAGNFRHIAIDPLASREVYFEFLFKRLARYIQTPFVLLVQWDGYVVDPRAWSADFLNYDYIGAKWAWYPDHMKVGNGGFSLRSKRLLDLLATAEYDMRPEINEDAVICRMLRAALENEHGIKFAPESVADQFSYELSKPDAPTFGFHGVYNLWRHCADSEMISMVELMDESTFRTTQFALLFANYLELRKWEPLAALYRRWRKYLSAEEVHRLLCKSLEREVPFSTIEQCERIFRRDASP